MELLQFQKEVHQTAKDKGWWDSHRSSTEIFCLITSELYEAFEYYRKGKKMTEVWDEGDGKREGIVVDLADFIIRILDYMAWKGVMVENSNLPDNYSCAIYSTDFPYFIRFCTSHLLHAWLGEEDIKSLEWLIHQTFTYCKMLNMPIDIELERKAEYNKSRSYRHGGKKL